MNDAFFSLFGLRFATAAYLMCVAFTCQHPSALIADDEGHVAFRIRDAEGGSLPCRVHIRDAEGRPVKIDSHPFWYDHFVCDGQGKIELPSGRYTYLLERGPEYRRAGGQFVLAAGERRTLSKTLTRATHMRDYGWYSADLHIHRPVDQIQILMRSSDLDIGPVITWWNQRNTLGQRSAGEPIWIPFDRHRYFSITAGEDERGGGALMYFGMPQAIDITAASREAPSPLDYVARARQVSPEVWIDIEKPFWWDVPIWLASEQANSIGIANNHMCWDQMLPNEAWGKPRDSDRLPSPLGNAYWTQEIYYHILNSGIRLPPSAGSASGVLPSPVGYNRVYAHVQGKFDATSWWDALRKGRCFVTNGPLLVCRANGRPPGSIFRQDDDHFQVELDIELTSQDRVRQLEVVCNGRIVRTIPLPDAERHSIQASVSCPGSGWFLVRAIADNERTFRFASTGPFYIERQDQPRFVSRDSTQFFADWVTARTEMVTAAMAAGSQRDAVLLHHSHAQRYWRERLAQANAK